MSTLREGGLNVAQDSCGRRDPLVLWLSRCSAPGLGQSDDDGSCGFYRIHHDLWSRGDLGSESFRAMALKSVARQAKSSANTNVFVGQSKPPTEAQLVAALGDSYELWQQLITDLKNEFAIDTADWHASSVKLGWSLRVQVKKRNIVYLSPRDGYFLASFALGDKAITAARKSDLSSSVLDIIVEAKRYPEGTAVRIEVRSESDLLTVKKLLKIKIDN